MPGKQLFSYSEGNRAQILATYVLSSLAAVVTVPREVDYGLDLLCTLTHHEGNALYAGRAFGVQVKSASDSKIRYGGIDKNGKWKGYELKWLFGQDQPIIICVADLKKWSVRLYSTARIWFLYYQVGIPTEVILIPDLELRDEPFQPVSAQDRYEDARVDIADEVSSMGNGYSYKVPLGKPIAEILVDDPDRRETRDALRECLNSWLDLDYRNIRHRKMDVPFTEEWISWEANANPFGKRILHYWNPAYDKNIREILESIAPAAAALLNNLNAQGQMEKLNAIVPFLHLIRDYGLLDPIGAQTLHAIENDNSSINR